MSDMNLTPPLGLHDLDWFVVMSKLSGRTPDENAGSVISYYVRRNKDAYKEILNHTAARLGLTAEECFAQLSNGETLESLKAKNAPEA